MCYTLHGKYYRRKFLLNFRERETKQNTSSFTTFHFKCFTGNSMHGEFTNWKFVDIFLCQQSIQSSLQRKKQLSLTNVASIPSIIFGHMGTLSISAMILLNSNSVDVNVAKPHVPSRYLFSIWKFFLKKLNKESSCLTSFVLHMKIQIIHRFE